MGVWRLGVCGGGGTDRDTVYRDSWERKSGRVIVVDFVRQLHKTYPPPFLQAALSSISMF